MSNLAALNNRLRGKETKAEKAEKPLSKMNKAELTALAETLGLDTGGTVAELRTRINEAKKD